MTTVSGTTTTTTTSNTAWVENLVTQMMTAEKKPLTQLQSDRDELNVERGIYTDIQSKMSAFSTSIDSLIGTDNVFGQYTTSTTTSGIVSASVSLGASPASYSITVSQLAQANSLRSNQQTDNSSALSLSGSFSLNGKTITVSADDSLLDLRDTINSATYDDGKEVTATIVDHRLILTSAESGSSSQIALEDLAGGSILQTLGFFSRSVTDGDNLVTEHGVTGFSAGELINFTSGALTGKQELSTGNLFVEIGSGKNANKFRLVDANGEVQAIASSSGGSTSTTDWISIDPENLSYDTGRGLIITFSNDGSWSSVSAGDGAANAVVDSSQLKAGKDAKLTVNGLSITRSSNAGLTDVINGVTLNLQSAGSTQLTISQSNTSITNSIQSALTNLNSLLNYLQAKTEPQKDTTNSTSSQTIYKAASLNDWTLKSLRRTLAFDMLSTFSGAGTGEPKSLADIGIELDDDTLTFTISDQSALTSALSTNSEAVSNLLNSVLTKAKNHVSPYVEGSNPLITIQQKSIDDQITSLNSRIDSTNARLVVRENALRTQYSQMYAQILSWQNVGTEYTSLLSYIYSSTA